MRLVLLFSLFMYLELTYFVDVSVFKIGVIQRSVTFQVIKKLMYPIIRSINQNVVAALTFFFEAKVLEVILLLIS